MADTPKKIINLPVYFFVYNIHGIGGTVRSVLNLATSLVKHGFSVSIVSLRYGNYPVTKFEIDPRIQLIDLFVDCKTPESSKFYRKSTIFEPQDDFYPRINQQIDLALIQFINKLSAGICIATIPSLSKISNFFNTQNLHLIVEEHSDINRFAPKFLKAVQPYYQSADAVVAITEQAKQDLMRKQTISPDKINIIPNILENSQFNTNYKKRIILSVGALTENKNVEESVKILAPILNDYPKWQFHIYGMGDEKKKIQSLIHEEGLAKQIKIFDPTPAIREKMAEAAIYVSTSKSESFGYTLVEALAEKMVPLVYQTVGSYEILKDIKFSQIPQGDMARFRKRVELLLENDKNYDAVADQLDAQDLTQPYMETTILPQWVDLFRKIAIRKITRQNQQSKKIILHLQTAKYNDLKNESNSLVVNVHGKKIKIAQAQFDGRDIKLNYQLNTIQGLLEDTIKNNYKLSTPVLFNNSGLECIDFTTLVLFQTQMRRICLVKSAYGTIYLRTYNQKLTTSQYRPLEQFYTSYSKNPSEIWLLGENGGHLLEDNAYALFQHIVTKINEHITPYLIVDNPQKYPHLSEQYGSYLIQKNSRLHQTLFSFTTKVIIAHSPDDIAYHSDYHHLPIYHLQHGVTFLKTINYDKRSYAGNLKRFYVSSEKEKSFLIPNFEEKQLPVTGFARHDFLNASFRISPQVGRGIIVYMPTWRFEAASRHEIENFIHNLIDRFESIRLDELLNQRSAILVIKLHPYFFEKSSFEPEMLSNFNLNWLRFDIDTPINRLVSKARIFITDYSSVFWEAIYQGVPAVIYAFDRDDYRKQRDSYEPISNYLKHGVVTTDTQLYKIVQDLLSRKRLALYEEENALSKLMFAYHDKQNRERIYQNIKAASLFEYFDERSETIHKTRGFYKLIRGLFNILMKIPFLRRPLRSKRIYEIGHFLTLKLR